MTAENDPTTQDPTRMSDHERWVAYRLLKRRLVRVKKHWNGTVSALKTELDHIVDEGVSKVDAENTHRWERFHGKTDQHEQAKKDRKTAVDRIEQSMDEIAFAVPAGGGEQLELGTAKAAITKIASMELRTALGEAKAEDDAAAAEGATPKYPPEKAGDMDDLRARLDAMMAEAGLDAVTFAPEIPAEQADPEAEDDEPEAANTSKAKPSKGRGKLSAVT